MQTQLDKTELFDRAVDHLQEQGIDTSFRPDYSGRGMYGDTTPAIVTDDTALVGWAVTAAMVSLSLEQGEELDAYELFDLVLGASELVPTRRDSMGLSTVVY